MWVIVNKDGNFWSGGKNINCQDESWCFCRNGATLFDTKYIALAISIELAETIVIDIDKNPTEDEINERIRKDFYLSYNWINEHPGLYDAQNENGMFNQSLQYGEFMTSSICPMIVLVNEKEISPTSGEWNSPELQTRVWLESGPLDKISDNMIWGDEKNIDPSVKEAAYNHISENGSKEYVWSHDMYLDCGGKSFEEAVCKLAKLVSIHYGEYDNDEYPWQK